MFLDPGTGPTYYSSTTTMSHTGGVEGWSRADEYDEHTFDDINEWNARTGSWDETQRHVANHQLQGVTESANFDVGLGKKVLHSYGGTLRSGVAIADDGGPALDLLPQNAPGVAPMVVSLYPSAPRPSIASNDGKNGGFTDEERRHAHADKKILTSEGATRELTLLRRQLGQHVNEASGEMHFRKAYGTQEVHVFFDPAIGGITRQESYENGVKLSQTVRRYHAEGNVRVLDQVRTQLFDRSGKPAGAVTETISNVQAH